MLISSITDLHSSRGRLLGLDVGEKTIGLALSDVSRIIATPYKTINRTKFSKDVVRLQSIVDEHSVVGLIIGYPINMDGSEGPRCQSVRQFVRSLGEKMEISMLFFDERMSTMAVTRTMMDADLSRARRAELVDKMAASYILQGVLDILGKK